MGLRILSLLLLVLASAGASALSEPKRVLILQSFRNALPINSEFFAGIREGLDLPTALPVQIDSETLDLSMVHDEEYVRKLVVESGFKFIWLRGLPLPELTESVKALPSHTAILYVTEVSPKFRMGPSRHPAQQRVHQRFSGGTARFGTNPLKILAQGRLGDDPADLGKGETGPPLHFVPALRIGL